jgi:hypothetical protein
MDRALVQQSLQRWNAYYKELHRKLIPRRDVPAVPKHELGLAISGVRRCGKTTLAVQVSGAFESSEVLYYNFEDPLFLEANDPLGIDILLSVYEQSNGAEPAITIFDEIQNVNGWERWVRSAVDQRRSRFIVTGSNAKLLSAEFSSSLTGRSLEHTTWPLSLSEAQDFLIGRSRGYCLKQLLTWGGLPAVLLTEADVEREQLLRQYLSDLVHRDILNRRNIRNKRSLDLLLMYYQTNLSSLHSYSAIKKAFGIPVDTVAEYTNALTEAFLVFEVERFHRNLKVQSRDPRKIYVIDAGLRRVAARSAEADIGKLLENQVYLELRRRKNSVYYYREQGEVDFVITEGYYPKTAIQVCAYGMDVKNTREREIGALVDCLQELELDEGWIITMDRNEIIETDNKLIRSVSAVDWLS